MRIHTRVTGAASIALRWNILICLVASGGTFAIRADAQAANQDANAAEIVAQMEQHNQQRAESLRKYRSVRLYHVEYSGFGGHKEAHMQVEATFESPDRKEFHITSESGSKLLLGRVLHRLLESEKEASSARNGKQNSLTRENYEFLLVGRERLAERPAYILQVLPRRNDKYLYRGKIWVDEGDYAVVRIEAEPAKNPSFWIKQTSIQHHYQKVGEFWLPEHNQSVSGTRFGGKAVLTIEYQDYEVNQPAEPGKRAGED
jgi:outer membrane lipoprotein-sorting protein